MKVGTQIKTGTVRAYGIWTDEKAAFWVNGRKK